jgi:type IV secretion system protein VirB1
MRNHCDTIGAMGPACVMAARHIGSVGYSCAAAAMLALSTIAASPAVGMPIAPHDFDALAKECAAGVSADVLRSVASKESHFEPFALHNNTRKLTRLADNGKAAASLAEKWIAAGDSVDVGLMQINAPNLAPLGLTVAQAFDPCSSLAAGAAVLRAAYSKGASAAEQQAALLIMLSRYNTGRPLNGLVNGYVGEIIAAGSSDSAPKPVPAVAMQPQETQAPSWDIWASAAYAKVHGATWIVDLTPTPAEPPSQAKADHQPRKP